MEFYIEQQINNTMSVTSNRENHVIYYENSLPSKRYDLGMRSGSFLISNLYAGIWTFVDFTTGNDISSFTVTDMAFTDFLAMIRRGLELSDSTYDILFADMIDLQRQNQTTSYAEIAYRSLINTEKNVAASRKKIIHFAALKIMNAIITYTNKMAVINNAAYDYIKFSGDAIAPELTGDFSITISISRFHSDTVNWETIDTRYVADSYRFDHLPTGLYTVTLMDERRFIVMRYVFVIYSEEDKQSFFFPHRKQLTDRRTLLEERTAESIGAVELSDEEIQVYCRQLLYAPQNFLLPAPVVSMDNYNDIFIMIPEYNCLAAFKKKLYIVAVEQDILEMNSMELLSRRFLITGPEMNISKHKYWFNDELYYFFIETEDHVKLSALTVFDITNPESDYQERAVKQMIYDRIKRQTIQLNYDFEDDIKRDILLLLDESMYNTSCSLYNLIDISMNSYPRRYDTADQFSALVSLYRDQVFHEYTDFDLFTKAVIRPQWGCVDFPVLGIDYIIQVTRFKDDTCSHQYYHSSGEAVSIPYRDTDYIVMSVFSELTGARIGGFLIFDNTQDVSLRYNNYNLEVEVDYE